MYDVFVSHSSHDESLAQDLAGLFRSRGYSTFLAPESIEPGSSWSEAIKEALEHADCTLVLVSDLSNVSAWVQQEIGSAMNREGCIVIPLLVGNASAELPGWLGKYQALRVSGEQDSELQEAVAKVLWRLGGVQSHLPHPNTLGELCLRRVLADQYRKPPLSGAWSKEYTSYLKFYYADREIPSHVSRDASLTFSAMTALRLLKYLRIEEAAVAKRLATWSLGRFLSYLADSQDPESGGFGRRSQVSPTRGPRPVHVDLRHTCWAVLALTALQQEDLHVDGAAAPSLHLGLAWLEERLEKPRKDDSVSWSAAAIHMLLSAETDLERISTPTRAKGLRAAEASLVSLFSSTHATWDVGPGYLGSPERSGIDNALYILGCFSTNAVQDEELQRQRSAALEALVRQCVPVPGRIGALGLPMIPGREPDYGASAQLLGILAAGESPETTDVEDQLIKFLLAWPHLQPSGVAEFSWYQASALLVPDFVFHPLESS